MVAQGSLALGAFSAKLSLASGSEISITGDIKSMLRLIRYYRDSET